MFSVKMNQMAFMSDYFLSFFWLSTFYHFHLYVCKISTRQLNGENLEGLDVDELEKLEKKLDIGLSRVTKIMVHIFIDRSIIFTLLV